MKIASPQILALSDRRLSRRLGTDPLSAELNRRFGSSSKINDQVYMAPAPGKAGPNKGGAKKADPKKTDGVKLQRQRIIFAVQTILNPHFVEAESIGSLSAKIVEEVLPPLREDGRLMLEVFSRFGRAPDAGVRRSELLDQRLREDLRRRGIGGRILLPRAKKTEDVAPFPSGARLLQVLLTEPGACYAALNSPHDFPAGLISPYNGGTADFAQNLEAPSRAFAKLLEAFAILGMTPTPGQRAADLGGSPGGWSYLLAGMGLSITGVDRSEYSFKLPRQGRFSFIRGDAFKYKPGQAVDLLVCDVAAEPERSRELLLKWIDQGWCGNFMVTLKFKGSPKLDLLLALEKDLEKRCSCWMVRRLWNNKNEVTAAGSVNPA